MVEVEANSQSRLLTETQEEYEFLERYIDGGKPPYPSGGHHFLIRTPFRYEAPTPPEYAGRFKEPLSNPKGFYGSMAPRTVFHEVAYHWLRERLHLPSPSQTPEPRTLFSVHFQDEQAFDVSDESNLADLTSRTDLGASWEFARRHPELKSIVYPSCRCSDRGLNVFTRDLATLGHNPGALVPFVLILRSGERSCYIVNSNHDDRWPSLVIPWAAVS
jgi:hypothetical protein